jgi:hypothetical protein
MQLTVEVGVADLAATRFAISPLTETILAVQLLGKPASSPVSQPWQRWARTQLDQQPLRVPRLWPLLTSRPRWPEWLAPAPRVRSPGIEDELAVLRQAPHARIESSLLRVFGDERPAAVTELLEDPGQALAAIAAELLDCHNRLIAPYWERMRAVLDADIAYRASGALASGGARSLLNDLHHDLRWSDGRLTSTSTADPRPDRAAVLGPDGLVLIPSVLIWPWASVKPSTSTQTTVRYPARGAAAVWEVGTQCLAATEALLGAPRARLLMYLRSPATPSWLAAQLGVTPSAISQHLSVLFRSGLADRQRSGRQVLYRASELGLALVNGSRGEEP